MSDFNLILENERLDKAVDAFAVQMKKVLHEKAKAGKRGWDGSDKIAGFFTTPTDEYIAKELMKDAEALAHEVEFPPCDAEKNNSLVIDIANRAMILWARHNSIAAAKPEGDKNNG
ncbi:MAG: hypothetical protein BWY66_00560 [bacterium ADurb.Bin374]|nr:MAG: hypothetical protein BWY66_00560 [bacterium ADurb.Bin374]